ncbi:MAG: hypothetical protein R2755_06225 [Acidimicrobiales bacterium]
MPIEAGELDLHIAFTEWLEPPLVAVQLRIKRIFAGAVQDQRWLSSSQHNLFFL